MNMTCHAAARSQQRCIPPMLIDLLLQFGSEERASGGVRKIFFDKSARRRLQAYVGPLTRMLEEHLDIYAVVGEDTKVVTVGYRTTRIPRH